MCALKLVRLPSIRFSCVSPPLSAVHAVPHSDTNTNKGSLLCVNGEPVSSMRQRLLRGLTQKPQSPWRTDQLQCTSTPASLTHKSELTSACQPRWKIYLSCLFLWLTIFFPLSPISRYVRKGEAGDEEAQRSGGQAERWDSSQGPWTDSKKWGHRSSKETQKLGALMRRGCFFSSCVNYKEFRYFLYLKYKRGLVRSRWAANVLAQYWADTYLLPVFYCLKKGKKVQG